MIITTMFRGYKRVLQVSDYVQFAIQTDSFEGEGALWVEECLSPYKGCQQDLGVF